MADGRSKVAWQHTSSVLCLLANINRDPKRQKAFTPAQFNPHTKPRRRIHRQISVHQLFDEIMQPVEGKR